MLTANRAKEKLENKIKSQRTEECSKIEIEINEAINRLQDYVDIYPIPEECTMKFLVNLGYKIQVFKSDMNETSLKIKW